LTQTLTLPYTRFRSHPSPAFPNRRSVDRPAIETSIGYQGRIFPSPFFSIIDSGADTCVFPAVVGSLIGIDVKSGVPETSVGVVGSGVTYYHWVTVYVWIQGREYHFDCYAGFLEGLNQMGFGLLGHHGFFDLFESVTLDSKRGMVELKVNGP
jgi:hypothetical protein